MKYRCYKKWPLPAEDGCDYSCNTSDEKYMHNWNLISHCMHRVSNVVENADYQLTCNWCGVGLKKPEKMYWDD